MPANIRWGNDEKTLALIEIEGEWSFENTLATYIKAIELVSQIDHQVHVIIDHTRETEQPETIGGQLPKFGELNIPPHVGLIIHVASKGSIRAANELFSKMYRKMHLVDLMEDAYALIRMYDERRAITKEE